MNLGTCKHLMSVVLLVIVGCDPKREIVGATVPGGETGGHDSNGGDDTNATELDGSSTQAGPPATTTTSGFGDVGGDEHTSDPGSSSVAMSEVDEGSSSAGPVGADGSPCFIDAEYGGGPILDPNPDCAGGLCLYAGEVSPPECEVDGEDECAGDERLGSCDGERCSVDPGWAAGQMACTQTCEEDVECPDVPGCETGRVCAPIALIGPLCCQKVCTCLDEVSQDWVNTRELECASGTHCG